MKYTPEQYAELLDKFEEGMPTVIARGRLAAAQQLRRDIPGRIHRRGGTKTIDGNTRGYRSESWVTEREDANLQINRVDHTFNGDLQRSYKLFGFQNRKINAEIQLKIFGQSNIDKARGNERWYVEDGLGKVWEASDDEETKARKAFNKEFTKYIKRFFK